MTEVTDKPGVPAPLAMTLVVSGIGVALLGQYALGASRFGFALPLFLVATALMLGAIWALGLTSDPFRDRWTAPGVRRPTPAPARSLGLLLLALAIGAGLVALLQMDPMRERATGVGYLLYALSLTLVVLAARVLDTGQQSSLSEPRPRVNSRRWRWVWIAAIVTAGLALRLYRLGELPFGTWYDESQAGLAALRVLGDEGFWPLFSPLINSMGHFILLVAASIRLFGPDTESIRLISALMGTATVAATYLVGRELFGRSFAWVPAFLVAFSRWNITVSRLGMYNASTPLFQLLALGFLLRGVRRRSYLDFALAGVFLGLGLCFYLAFWLFIPPLAVFLAVLIIRECENRRSLLAGLALTIMATILATAPVAQFARQRPDLYFRRIHQVRLVSGSDALQRLEEITQSTAKHLLMFNVRGDRNGRHNLPGEPMLDPVSGSLMVTGLGLCLARVRRPLLGFLPLWWGCALAAGILSVAFEAPQSLRAVGAQPAACLLAAIPLHVLWRATRRVGDGWATLSLLSLLLPIGWLNITVYFHQQARSPEVWAAHSLAETWAARRLRELGPDTEAYLTAFINDHPTLRFLTWGESIRYQILESHDSLPRAWPSGKEVILLVSDLSVPIREQAARLYPGAEVVEHGSPYGGWPVLYELRLSEETLQTAAGLTGTYWPDSDRSGDPVLRQSDPRIELDWREKTPVPPPFSVEWQGVLRVEEFGPHGWKLESPGQAELLLGESLLLEGEGHLEANRTLARGNHDFRLKLLLTKGQLGQLRLSWRPPGAQALQIVPSEVFFSIPVTGNGLLGSYYPNDRWEEPATMKEIHPRMNLYYHLLPLDLPFSVEWLGAIQAPARGRYGFRLESIDGSGLEIDGRKIIPTADSGGTQDAEIELEAGLHSIRVRLAARTGHIHLNLSWRPPEGTWSTVPTEVLFPPPHQGGS